VVDWSTVRARSVQVSDSLSAILEEMILGGAIGNEERLPAERELAQALGVSRTSLREALHELELKGLINRRPGRGTIVVDTGRGTLGESLLNRLDSPERTLREVMDLRSVIEPPIAARAAQRRTPQDLERLRGLTAEIETHTEAADVAAIDIRFHEAIGRATHNPLLVRLLGFAAEWIDESRRERVLSSRRRQHSIRAHAEILDAIERRDAAGAFDAMERHISSVSDLLTGEVDRR